MLELGWIKTQMPIKKIMKNNKNKCNRILKIINFIYFLFSICDPIVSKIYKE